MKKIDNIYIKRFGYFNIYVIRGIDGDVLIDTGFLFMKRNLKKWLDTFNIKTIILTHAHIDHIWNAAYLKELYNCDVMICENDLKNIDNSNIHSIPSKKKYFLRIKFMNLGMRILKPQKFKIDKLLKDEMLLEVNGLKLKIISLTGHTEGSIGILYKHCLFCGDALVNRKRFVEIPYQNQNNINAYKSALKIYDLKPQIIFIGHEFKIKFNKLEKSINSLKKELTKNEKEAYKVYRQ